MSKEHTKSKDVESEIKELESKNTQMYNVEEKKEKLKEEIENIKENIPENGIPLNGSLNTKEDIDIIFNNIKGKTITLEDGIIIWRSTNPDNIIELNRLSGDIIFKVPEEMNDKDKEDICRGLYYGKLRIIRHKEKVPPSKNYINEPNMKNMTLIHEVNNFLDEKHIDNFKIKIDKISSKSYLTFCINIEENDRNRNEYKSIIQGRLNQLN